MFVGSIDAKLDEKGRAFFPAAFRKQIGDTEQEFVLRRDVYQPCLVIFPNLAWQAEVEALRSRLNRWNPEHAMLLRQYLAAAEVFKLDANGRFLLPRHLLSAAGIERDVTFVGADDRIELWSKRTTGFLEPETYAKLAEGVLGLT